MNIAHIIQEIKLFCDPFTEIKQKPVSGRKRIVLIRNGRELTYDFNITTGRISANHRSAEFRDIKSLLASPEFSDISRFAETQKRAFKEQKNSLIIKSEINYSGKIIQPEDLLDNMSAVEGKLNLVLLDGPAGVGKTFQITQIAKTQLSKFLKDNVSPPVLHISSTGRRLSNFRDVLAATTQEMGASFSGVHVPLLVRHGLLVAAIDGFDELVDADGYEDSWRALAEFVKEVGSAGKIILAARDTFLDEQEFLERIGEREDLNIHLDLAHINLVSVDDAVNYLSESISPAKADNKDAAVEILTSNSYARRPFFLALLKEAGGWKKVQAEGLRTFLVENILERESKILSRTLGSISSDLAIAPLNALFEEVALEMAVRETNLIENEHLAFLTEYCFGEQLDDTAKRKLSHKAGSISLLELSEIKGKRKFPHTEIQFYFLGKSLISQLQNKVIPSVLRRTILGAEHLEVFSEIFLANENSTKSAVNQLQVVLSGDNSNDRLASNGGAIVLLGFALGLVSRVDYVLANDATFAGGTPDGTLQNIDINRLDACGCNMSKVIFDNVKIATLVVDKFTQFGNNRPNIGVLEIRNGDPQLERDPERIDSYIDKNLLLTDKDALMGHPLVQLLGKVARRSIRYCYLKDGGEGDEGSLLLRDPRWVIVKRILEKNGRLEIKKGKQMHGRPAALIRVKRPIDLLDFSLKETQVIAKELAELNN